ncbi:hypothetical protein Aph01nite_06810 [Acrocarpospora phusangensis]|uniref:Glycosyl transferase n=1 Tax=Acrocarpospora phusangensis TaxID=1070424 RepID=A0A919Q692_9ACTN|nr:WecB/TagA/CpsF family glycosyltransferase [Acrocarpospora phusangensis]GIH22371.1 hypothetical protein Aph01nite_06810 [Acrocarpospora phusangensis]
MLGTPLDALTMEEVLERCVAAIDQEQPLSIGVVNAAKIVNMRTDPALASSVVESDLVLADGQSVVWASRVLGSPIPERVAGIDLFVRLMAEGERRGFRAYFLGAKPEVLQAMLAEIRRRFPALPIAGARDGYFAIEDSGEVAAEIAESGADMLFLGITSPKKEIFIREFGARTRAKVIHGVGGSFDVLAGWTRRAPESWQRLGLEWLYRTLQEPTRLAPRYFKTNGRFILMVAGELLRRNRAPIQERTPVLLTEEYDVTPHRRIALMGSGADLLPGMVSLAIRGLPPGYADGEFVFTRRGVQLPDGRWSAVPEGRSVRYSAIVALGVATLPEDKQREALNGETARDLAGHLIDGLPEVRGLGDAALICWAAAETGHDRLDVAVQALTDRDAEHSAAPQVYTVEAAWALAGYVAAGVRDERLARSRERLLAGLTSDRLYRHVLGEASGTLVPWYRAHVGCFADQVYPLQALARLHAAVGDPEALAAAERVAAGICTAQGEQGQWWWHYDARTGSVVEGYPVYSVHQLAMAPMALLDLADAGGTPYVAEIAKGLSWMTERPESAESLIDNELALTWRKAARADPKKIVRGLRAVATRASSGARLATLDRLYPPVTIDRECRPYELGWLLYAWLFEPGRS